MSTDSSRLARIAAESSLAFGVDAVPVYTRGAHAGAEVDAEVETKPDDTAATPSAAADAVRASAGSSDGREAELARLLARYEADAPHQHFVTDHHKIVFHDGDPHAKLMFIGEAPGADEDRVGKPFVGRAGQLLDKMIVAMGLSRESVYIANVLKTRPPNNQTPTLEEAELCAPYLVEQIRIVRPEVIVTLGLPATRLILNTSASMGSMRGKWAKFPAEGASYTEGLPGFSDAPLPEVAVMPTYHPAYLLRSYTPENRKKVWSDLKMAMDRLGLG